MKYGGKSAKRTVSTMAVVKSFPTSNNFKCKKIKHLSQKA